MILAVAWAKLCRWFTVFVLIIVILAALAAVNKQHVTVDCGTPSVSTPWQTRDLDGAKKLGEGFRSLMKRPSPLKVAQVVNDTLKMITYMFHAFRAALRMEDEPSWLVRARELDRQAQQKALLSCCPVNTPPDQNPSNPAPDPFDPRDASYQQGDGFTAETLRIAATAAAVQKAQNIPAYGLVVILAAGMQESGDQTHPGKLRNLNYGDADSVGWLQQRRGWGSVAQRMDPRFQAAGFFKHLVRVNGWERMSVTRAAQAVQISAYPNAYAKWEVDARALARQVQGTPEAPSDTPNLNCAPDPNPTDPVSTPTPTSFNHLGNPRTVNEAVAWLTQMSRNRTPITPNQCSHYMANAYGWSNSGSSTALSLWRSIPSRYKHAGKTVPPRGALVFWATSTPAGHIAISLGNGKVATTDVPKGRIGLVTISKVDQWGPRQGWAAPYWPAHSHDTTDA